MFSHNFFPHFTGYSSSYFNVLESFYGSSTRYSNCWNKKSRPQGIKNNSYSSSYSKPVTPRKTSILVLFSIFLVTLTIITPRVATASTESTTPSSSSIIQPHSNHNNTNVASQNKLYSLFNQESPISTTHWTQYLTVGSIDALIDTFGSNGSMGKDQLSQMMEKVLFSLHHAHHLEQEETGKTKSKNKIPSSSKTSDDGSDITSVCKRFISATSSSTTTWKNITNLNAITQDGRTFDNNQLLLSCQLNKCLNASSIFNLYNLSDDYRLTKTDLLLLSPLILKQGKSCQEVNEEVVHFSKSSEAWAYGFLFVTVINVCALVGVVVLPIMNTRIYKKVLLFLVALAVGSLAGSGLLVLIPEAFELVGTREEKHAYLWMGTTIMSGIYLFFLIERFLKMVFEWKKRGKSASEADYDVIMDKNENRQIDCTTDELSDIVCSVKSKTPVDLDTAKMKDPANYHASASQCTSHLSRTESSESIQVKLQKKSTTDNGSNFEVLNGCLHTAMEGAKKKKAIRTVAWMIIFGDGLHNFIDGLSIGAAFTANIMTGVSVSVAVICEELPHELGDFAILLNAGMSMKQALCFNFLSACMCYIGLIFGILLAEATAAHTWIFGVAGGMFLYISLVDMMPEMNQVVEAKENKELGKAQLFILQNVGMILGFGIILVISLYAEKIQFVT